MMSEYKTFLGERKDTLRTQVEFLETFSDTEINAVYQKLVIEKLAREFQVSTAHLEQRFKNLGIVIPDPNREE